MSKFEKKFGRYAIPNLPLVLICSYIVGYIIQFVNGNFLNFLTLDPVKILSGQVWRLLTWVIVPPERNVQIFTIIMLLFIYSIGSTMEKTLGTYRFNVFVFTGILLTIVAAFLCAGLLYVWFGNFEVFKAIWELLMLSGGHLFNTYYLTTTVFLAFAVTYPNMSVLLMFVIPVKVKWMGILEAGLMVYLIFTGDIISRFVIGAALLNFVIFYLRTRNLSRLRPKDIKRRVEFKQQVRQSTVISKHKCAVCGRTDEEFPDLQFRFCSKCNGNYEYCQDHLFTHEHVK